MKYFIDTNNSLAKRRAFSAFKQAGFTVTGSVANHTIAVNSNAEIQNAKRICQMYNVDLKPTDQRQQRFQKTTYLIRGKLALRNELVNRLKALETTHYFKSPGVFRRVGSDGTSAVIKTQDARDILLSNVQDLGLRYEVLK